MFCGRSVFIIALEDVGPDNLLNSIISKFSSIMLRKANLVPVLNLVIPFSTQEYFFLALNCL